MKYLWDTNTVIYFLQQQFPPAAEQYMDQILSEEAPIISAITEIELLCWKAASETDMQTLLSFIEDAIVIELDRSVRLKAAEVRKTHNLKLPDAIIAATALNYNLNLITRNERDFGRLQGLKIINPFEL